MAAEARDKIDAALAEMEYLISGLVGGDTTEWRFVNPELAPASVVVGATELIAKYQG